MDTKEHLGKAYGTRAPDVVSWYAPHLETSLASYSVRASDE
jgi:hypothetical protein